MLRYTAMIDAAPDCMKQPMRDLIPQVQSLMRLRSFRIMTNRYVSAAAAVVLGFVMWGAVQHFGVPNPAACCRSSRRPAGTLRYQIQHRRQRLLQEPGRHL